MSTITPTPVPEKRRPPFEALAYDAAFLLFVSAYLPRACLRGRRLSDLTERRGRLPEGTPEGGVWVHAVSVGEVALVQGLLAGLRERHPGRPLVLTTVTPAGYDMARRIGVRADVVLRAPLDLSGVVRRYRDRLRPCLYIAAETELWPNLFLALEEAEVPIVIVNGRISDSAFRRYLWIRRILAPTLRRVRFFGMQSAKDAERVITLGALPERVRVTGNLKFDAVPPDAGGGGALPEADPDLRWWVAGSTHAGEEEAVLDVYRRLRPGHPDLRLILVPRHVERARDVAELVRAAGERPAFFPGDASGGGKGTPVDRIWIVNVIGRLKALYASAEIVFVGKSLTARGGHNVIEPALFGKPIVVGPHMDNFRGVEEAFIRDRALVRVRDVEELHREMRRLLDHPGEARELGRRAARVVAAQRGATARTLDEIDRVWGAGA